MSKNQTALTTKDNNELALTDLQNEFASAMTVRREILKTPYLKLTNGMSDALSSGVAKLGEFACDIKGISYGKEVTIIPLVVSESASLLFNPKNPPSKMSKEDEKLHKNGDVLCSSPDLIRNNNNILCRACPFGEFHMDWGTKQSPKVPQCKQSIDVILLVDQEITPMILSFRKTNYSAGRALVNYIANDSKALPFSNKFTLKSEETISKNQEKYMMISETMQKVALTNEEILKIVPIARKILLARSRGQLQYEDTIINENSDIPI